MKHKCTACGHEDEINPGKLLGGIRTPKREAAWKKHGERLKKMFANLRKLEESRIPGTIDIAIPRQTMSREDMQAAQMEPRFVEAVASIPPMPATLEEKKAAAMAALASLGKDDGMYIDDYAALHLKTRSLLDTPRAPFDVNLEGEPHRVTTLGKKLALFYIGGGEPVFSRYLAPGELESFWETRIK